MSDRGRLYRPILAVVRLVFVPSLIEEGAELFFGDPLERELDPLPLIGQSGFLPDMAYVEMGIFQEGGFEAIPTVGDDVVIVRKVGELRDEAVLGSVIPNDLKDDAVHAP